MAPGLSFASPRLRVGSSSKPLVIKYFFSLFCSVHYKVDWIWFWLLLTWLIIFYFLSPFSTSQLPTTTCNDDNEQTGRNATSRRKVGYCCCFIRDSNTVTRTYKIRWILSDWGKICLLLPQMYKTGFRLSELGIMTTIRQPHQKAWLGRNLPGSCIMKWNIIILFILFHFPK